MERFHGIYFPIHFYCEQLLFLDKTRSYKSAWLKCKPWLTQMQYPDWMFLTVWVGQYCKWWQYCGQIKLTRYVVWDDFSFKQVAFENGHLYIRALEPMMHFPKLIHNGGSEGWAARTPHGNLVNPHHEQQQVRQPVFYRTCSVTNMPQGLWQRCRIATLDGEGQSWLKSCFAAYLLCHLSEVWVSTSSVVKLYLVIKIFTYQMFCVKIIWIRFHKPFTQQDMHTADNVDLEFWDKMLITATGDHPRALVTSISAGLLRGPRDPYFQLAYLRHDSVSSNMMVRLN